MILTTQFIKGILFIALLHAVYCYQLETS